MLLRTIIIDWLTGNLAFSGLWLRAGGRVRGRHQTTQRIGIGAFIGIIVGVIIAAFDSLKLL